MKESLRSFLKAKAETKTSDIQRILSIPDGVFEKVTSNVPIRAIYELKSGKRNSK